MCGLLLPDISIGVCVYNEEKNIRGLLNSLLNQTTKRIIEIIVVSSACSDKTDEIIENDFLKSNSKVVLLKQKRREGKASAINLFLKYARGEIVVLESGDTTPAIDAIENLIEPFNNPKTGMTGGHPIPVNDPDTFMGFTVHLLWDLHHKLALKNPKFGELVAFRRNLVTKIPADTAVDEASIEALIKEKGYELKYAPHAIVYNKGPETILDFLKQRRRIFAGHIHLKKTKDYTVSSMKKLNILRLILEEIKLTPKNTLWATGAILLEFCGRACGWYDFYMRKDNPFIWDISGTTKSYIPEQIQGNVISPIQRIELWSMMKQHKEISKPQGLSAAFLWDASISIANNPEIIPKTPFSTELRNKNKPEINLKTPIHRISKYDKN